MSVWPDPRLSDLTARLSNATPALGTPQGSNASLSGAEGELMSIRISIEPRLLEKLLDTLAQLDFPINPQIYHQATLIYVYGDGERRVQPATTVEFPAYASRLPEVRAAFEQAGFDPASLHAKSMLDDITSDFDLDPAPAGAPYQAVIWYRQADGAH